MKEIIQKIKMPIIIVLVIFVGFFTYNKFFVNKVEDGVLTKTNEDAKNSTAARELVVLLNKVSTVRFDISIFNNRSYKTLQNFTQNIISEPRGKRNPFIFEAGSTRSASSSVESLGFQDETSIDFESDGL